MDATPRKCTGPTLCWDCANAIGGCNWADSLAPVDGWDAQYIPDKDSYHVFSCPLFERDAQKGGLERVKHLTARREAN